MDSPGLMMILKKNSHKLALPYLKQALDFAVEPPKNP
jgi:hypothetical protein